jgi:Glu-tRNA(Gln) amidotransferase subunit E-like FAD-binding protein
VGGIIHSDEELAKYRISDAEAGAVREALRINAGEDAFVLDNDSSDVATETCRARGGELRDCHEVLIP